MNDDRAFEHATQDWLESGSDQTSPATIDAVLLAVRTTPQERDLRVPWRTPRMTSFQRIAASIAAVVVVAVVAVMTIGRSTGPGNTVATPSPSPSASTTASSPPVDTTAWTDFTSGLSGFSARYPTGWAVTPATTIATLADLTSAGTAFDHFKSATPPADELLGVSSKLPVGMAQADWIAAYRKPVVDQFGPGCFPPPDQWQPVTVDGHAGGLYVGCNYVESMTFVQGRAYIFTLARLTGFSPNAATEALLRAFLSTVTIDPAAAVDSPAPS